MATDGRSLTVGHAVLDRFLFGVNVFYHLWRTSVPQTWVEMESLLCSFS